METSDIVFGEKNSWLVEQNKSLEKHNMYLEREVASLRKNLSNTSNCKDRDDKMTAFAAEIEKEKKKSKNADEDLLLPPSDRVPVFLTPAVKCFPDEMLTITSSSATDDKTD